MDIQAPLVPYYYTCAIRLIIIIIIINIRITFIIANNVEYARSQAEIPCSTLDVSTEYPASLWAYLLLTVSRTIKLSPDLFTGLAPPT